MISKKVLQRELETFPDYFTIDELVGKLIVLEKVEEEKIDSSEPEIPKSD